MFVKLHKVLLDVPVLSLQNHVLKSTSQSKGFVITILKKSENKGKVKASQNLINKDIFGPVLKTSKKRNKGKPTNLPAADFHQDASNLSTPAPNDYENPVARNDLNQVEHCSNLKNSNTNFSLSSQNTPFSITREKLLNGFNAFNEKKCILYPQNDNIYSIRSFDDKYSRLPSVTKILQETMSPERKQILQKWEENKIMELGVDGFKAYKQNIFDCGKLFHTYVEQSLQNKIEDDFQNVKQYIKSVKDVLGDIENVKLLESRVVHPYLQYQGYVDCVGLYRGNPVVIDFKTSSKAKATLSSTYDNPLQVAAYLGAINYDPSYETLPSISSALLVIAYETGMPAHVHLLNEKNCLKYWNLWYRRLFQFKNMTSEHELGKSDTNVLESQF